MRSRHRSRPRVLVARLDSLGDVLVTGPAIRAIAAHADVTLLCSGQGARVAPLLPGVSRFIAWDCPWITSPSPALDPAEIQQMVDDIGALNIDEAVVLTSFHQSPLPLALMLRMAGVSRITGASVDHAGALLDNRLRPGETLPEDVPEPERALAIASAAGFTLPADDDGRLQVQGWEGADVDLPARPYAVLHPGASAPARTWPATRFRDTAVRLAEQGIVPVVTGSAHERALTAQVAGNHGVDLGGALDIKQLAHVIAGARAIVVANTGPAHLAAAVGTPVVSLFAPVVPSVRWAPYGVPHVLLGDQHAPCAGSRWRECAIPGHPCLSDVTADDVWEALESVWETRKETLA
ncbi:glycosyltransferase family 9 protein [Demequina sp. SO4-13]|uniref:glycosyltransferase family 9 protein n=1 Tax=Demequina sp. SO4-13 TaxID=3401027 RepID=UPI003AF7BC35